jgi:hypothetical protein
MVEHVKKVINLFIAFLLSVYYPISFFLNPLALKLIATWPLSSREGYRPPKGTIDGFQEGVWIRGGW